MGTNDEKLIERAIQWVLSEIEDRLRERARILVCPICHRKFVAFNRKRRFCSKSCRNISSWRRKHKKVKS